MDAKTTLPVTEARKQLFSIIDKVGKNGGYYTLTEKGRPKVVIISAEEFDSWVETWEVMKDFPDLEKDIKETEKDIKSGKYKDYITLEELLSKEGYILRDKSIKKYDVSRKTKTKSKKRA